jgi:hypothetical protein
MKNILKQAVVFLLIMWISKEGNAQDYYSYQAFDAVLLQQNNDLRIESKLKKVVIALSNNSTQLSVETTIPFNSIENVPEDYTVSEVSGLLFNLRVNIDLWQIQDYLTSGKVFNTHGYLTLNNTTKPIKVEYMALPASTDVDGDFNISMTIQFNGCDFNIDTPFNNSCFIIKINKAKVNRE